MPPICQLLWTSSGLYQNIYLKTAFLYFQVSIDASLGFPKKTGTFKGSTSIGLIKKTFIDPGWKTNSRDYSLEYEGKKLSDDTSLASLYTGEELELRLHSYYVTVKSEKSWEKSFEIPVLIQEKDFVWDADIIKAYVNATQDINIEDISVYVQSGEYVQELHSFSDFFIKPGQTAIIKPKVVCH